jgi:alkylation response protein AidB-like acyl-CoA dehydrogenase
MSEFFQDAPKLGNQYDDDSLLCSYLKRQLPAALLKKWEPDFKRFGEMAAHQWLALAAKAENQPPVHVPYDAWGNRVDHIEVSEAWKEFDRISAEEGLVALGYERADGAFSRINQFVRLFLFAPSSAIYTCPLAMTDGAARAIEIHGSDAQKKKILPHLTSRDPLQFWTSGQWMTERTGGSDVSGTSTVAKLENGKYRLYGTKWFTSATTSQMAMTLARIEGAPQGSRGLSLFYLELKDTAGKLNHIEVHRLKEKLGTHALPTAELTLKGAVAELVGDQGNGVKKISALFNITRIYNACCAVAGMRRALALAHDYAGKRRAFGKLLKDHPLHMETLRSLDGIYERSFHLLFRTVELLGKDEVGRASIEESKMLRLLTPLVKLYTAKQGVTLASEVLESFGGAGYVEDTGLPRLLRDAQVLAIWEGTTNVLSLDVLRAIEKENALEPLLKDMRHRDKNKALSDRITAVERGYQYVTEAQARKFAWELAEIYGEILTLEHS